MRPKISCLNTQTVPANQTSRPSSSSLVNVAPKKKQSRKRKLMKRREQHNSTATVTVIETIKY